MIEIPRWTAFILASLAWFVAIPFAHGVIPWAISLLTPRWGWTEGRPGTWNLLGLLPVVLSAALLIWVFVVGVSLTPPKVKLGLTPAFLMTRGPYTLTRNPMYVAELGLWLGWALFFGSIGVLVMAAALGALVNFVVRREEHTLERVFGEIYVQYKSKVPRWIGTPGR